MLKFKRISIVLSLCVLAFSFQTFSKNRCLWFEKFEHGDKVQEFGISIDVVKLLSHQGSSFNMNGIHMTFDSLLTIYDEDQSVTLNDNKDNSRIEIHRGKFSSDLNEESDKHNCLIMESSGDDEKTNICKLKIRSIEGIAALAALFQCADVDEALDALESALPRGGVFYSYDFQQHKRVWVYVN